MRVYAIEEDRGASAETCGVEGAGPTSGPQDPVAIGTKVGMLPAGANGVLRTAFGAGSNHTPGSKVAFSFGGLIIIRCM